MPVRRFSPTRLKDLREQRGLSRIDVAFYCGRTEQTCWLWERGRVTPSVETLTQIASVLGCSLDDLFEGATDGAR